MSGATDLQQGIREHLPQFSLHVLLVFATGLTIGSERAVVPVIGRDLLGVESLFVIGSFVVSFGFVKALLNLYAGKWGEEYGRKPVLIIGWATALPLPIILISYVMSVTVVVISTAEGLNKIPEIFFDASRSLNLTSYQSITRVQLPAAVPYIFTGLKLGFIYAFIGVIASEFILANAGLGYFVSLQYERFETAEMYASIAVIVVFAATINSVLVRVEDRLYKRGAR